MSSSKSKQIKIQATTHVEGIEALNLRMIESIGTKNLSAKAQKKNDERNKAHIVKTYADLFNELKGKATLWEDPDFLADSSSVFLSKASPNYREFEWKRPKDISADPKLFTGGVSRYDVQQETLGDGWLQVVVALLYIYQPIFKNVMPDDQDFDSNYIGAFRFHFWRFGKWCEIIVDDRIPTFRGKLVFMHSTGSDEYWPALLEKAYAKMCGTYESLNGGSQSEAMEDLTGGLCETIKLNQKERPIDLFKQMTKFAAQSSLIGCSIESTRADNVLMNGLITGHAYCVTGVARVTKVSGKMTELVRVRNLWAKEMQWKGRWCDNASEWSTISKDDKIRVCGSLQNDGEFWMNFDDFADNFTKLEICHLGHERLEDSFDGKRKWEMSLENGSWTKNINAGGCRNFSDTFITNTQYRLEIIGADEDDEENMGTVIVGLLQKDMRKQNLDFYVIGYVIYKLKDPKCGILNKSFFKFTTTVAKSPNFVNQREICGRHKLPAGHYVIIPSTFNPNEETDYILRIFSQKPNKTKELDVNNNRIGIAKHLTTLESDRVTMANNSNIIRLERELNSLFNRVSDRNDLINASQLRDILNAAFAKDITSFDGFSFEVCRSMIALTDENQTGKMEFNEFLNLFRNLRIWKTAFRDFDVNNNGVFDAFELRNALNNCGLVVSNSLFRVLANRYSNPVLGVITFEDFIMAVIRLTNAFETIELQLRDSNQRLVFTTEDFTASLLYM